MLPKSSTSPSIDSLISLAALQHLATTTINASSSSTATTTTSHWRATTMRMLQTGNLTSDVTINNTQQEGTSSNLSRQEHLVRILQAAHALCEEEQQVDLFLDQHVEEDDGGENISMKKKKDTSGHYCRD